MSKPFFSIIVPTYNRSAFVKRLAESFLRQTYPHFELIIVDDGGSDDTETVLRNLDDMRVIYIRKENGERGAARKFGAAMSQGDYINYFDSDDIPYENHLQTAVGIIKEINEPMVFHLGFEYRDEQGGLLSKSTQVVGVGNKKMLYINYINPNPMFVHRNTLTEVMYNDDRNLAGCEDWLYHLQLAARYKIMAFGNKITSYMVQHDNRSMNQWSGDDVLRRNEFLLEYLQADPVFYKQFGWAINNISAEMTSLAALHYVLQGKKKKSVKTLFKSFGLSAKLIFERRTLAIGKYFLFG